MRFKKKKKFTFLKSKDDSQKYDLYDGTLNTNSQNSFLEKFKNYRE